MVRRRTRACASSKTAVAHLLTNGGPPAVALSSANPQLLDDQYFVNHKRKDAKIEDTAFSEETDRNSPATTPEADVNNAFKSKPKSCSPSKTKGEHGSSIDRTIGVPLATRSQTRTIEYFFKPKQNKATDENTAECVLTESCNKMVHPTLSASVTPLQMTQVQLQYIEQQKQQINGDHNYQQQSPPQPKVAINRHSLGHVVVPEEFIYDLSEDTNDSEHTDLSEESPPALAMGLDHGAIAAAAASIIANGLDFTTHRSAQRADSHSSSNSSSNDSATENIFLQEPVLTLNVDKSPNQASSIKINKTLEVEPKFSSPTSLTASVLHGHFNQIQLTSPSKRDSFGYEKKPLELSCHNYAILMLPENENSSCDNGVTFHKNVLTGMNKFFPVRRSVRKTKTVVKEEMMRNLEQAILQERSEGLKVAHFEGKGRGVIAERRFQRGEFVIEYAGDLVSTTEAARREKRYALDENAGCYMYYFKHKDQQYCIDATEDTGKLGRLVNHSRTGNLMTKVVVVKQKPHLVLIAKDDIEAGEELCYDYGDRSKESLLHHPWLAF